MGPCQMTWFLWHGDVTATMTSSVTFSHSANFSIIPLTPNSHHLASAAARFSLCQLWFAGGYKVDTFDKACSVCLCTCFVRVCMGAWTHDWQEWPLWLRQFTCLRDHVIVFQQRKNNIPWHELAWASSWAAQSLHMPREWLLLRWCVCACVWVQTKRLWMSVLLIGFSNNRHSLPLCSRRFKNTPVSASMQISYTVCTVSLQILFLCSNNETVSSLINTKLIYCILNIKARPIYRLVNITGWYWTVPNITVPAYDSSMWTILCSHSRLLVSASAPKIPYRSGPIEYTCLDKRSYIKLSPFAWETYDESFLSSKFYIYWCI